MYSKISPWQQLIQHQYFQWQEQQYQVSSAALLSPSVSPAGFYINPANYDEKLIKNLQDTHFEGKGVSLSSETLDSLISEYIDLFEKSKQEQRQYRITSIPSTILKQVNSFIKTRGAHIRYNDQQLKSILNVNLQIITTQITKDILPANDSISIELLYGFMIAHYGREILLRCPQLSVLMVTTPLVQGLNAFKSKDFVLSEPRLRKLKQLIKKISKLENIPYFKRIGKREFTDIFSLRDYIQKKFDQVKDNAEYSKKSRNRLRKLIHNINKHTQLKQDKFETRKDILNVHLSSEEDYRLQDSWECIFYMSMKQALNRIPTTIDVFNNNTLRNPKLHLVFPFLKEKSNEEIERLIQNDQVECQNKIKKLSLLVKRARELGYFKSDWQNKLARVWSEQRNSILAVLKERRKQKKLQKFEQNKSKIGKVQAVKEMVDEEHEDITDLQVPPPIQYALAYDLVPYSHPFAFTYGRHQGYCLDLEQALVWFASDCSTSEKAYFYSILAHPEISERFDFLLEIPPQLRVFKPKKQMENEFITKLNSWLVKNEENKDLETVKQVRSFVRRKQKALPGFLKKKLDKNNISRVSILSLFGTIFDIYNVEDIYLEGVPLKKPFIYEPINKIASRAHQEEITDINDYWGPPCYGGSIFNQNSQFDRLNHNLQFYS